MTIGPARTINVPQQNYEGVSQEQVGDFNEAFSSSTTSSNASGMQSSKGEHTSEHSQDTSKSLPFVLATRPPINLGSPTGKQGAPFYDTQGKGSEARSETAGSPNNPDSSEDATKPGRVADNDQANPKTRTTGTGAGPTSNPVRVLPHIHLENHPKPGEDLQRVTMQQDCDRYKGKADALVFMEHGGFYGARFHGAATSCKAGQGEPVAILGSECHVTINRTSGTSDWHHTGIWFVDEKTRAASGISCGASPKDEKAAVVKAGGLLAFHHPEYPYIEKAEQRGDKTPSATVLKYTLPKDQAEPFDMVEVWNKGGFTGGDVENVLKWTERNFYDRGLFPAVISGMDDHGPEHKAIAYTMIDSNSGTDRDAIKAAVQARKTWVSSDQNARVSVDQSKAGETTFNLSHLKPGSTVEILQDGKSLGKQAITGDSFSSTVKGSSGYAYAKVYDANTDKPDLYLITSAAQLK
jgi:hypothetical protein